MLKPCPYCGDDDIATVYDPAICSIIARCHNCGADGSPADTKQEAITAWNRRTSTAEDKLKRVAEIVEKYKKLNALYMEGEVNVLDTYFEVDKFLESIEKIVEEK